MKFSGLAKAMGGVLIGSDGACNDFSSDSRAIKPGDCFIAIKGDFFDGHDFMATVVEKGAAVAIVDRDVVAAIPLIRVKNTRQALIDLARFYRENTAIPVIGITGSCGKTTTRALVENILKQAGKVLASQKSFNNDIGLPLTLLQLKPDHDFVVLEMGTNHPGEIAALTAIAQPTISVVTMVSAVHVEGFGSVENIAEEKADIYKTADIAVINADDPFCDFFLRKAQGKRVITFGMHRSESVSDRATRLYDVTATDIKITPDSKTTFTLHCGDSTNVVHLPLLGAHNVTNALAATAIAFALKIPLEKIKQGLESTQPEYGRLTIKRGMNGSTIIDDSYNANPASVKAAINVLSHRSKNTIVVFGDMKELGADAEKLHTDIGEYAKNTGIKQLFCYGQMSANAANAFGKNAQHFTDQQKLIDTLKSFLSEDVTVLVKGSNSMKMNKIVNAISHSH